MVERVLQIAGNSPDLILDTAPAGGVLPALIRIAGNPALTQNGFLPDTQGSVKWLSARGRRERPERGLSVHHSTIGRRVLP
jgi:hypothetical protein